MFEFIGNLHIHTNLSDGSGSHDEVAMAAARAGLDFIIYTDHNIWLDGLDGWYHDFRSGRKVLRLMGQEVNDPNRYPELNHLLCYFVNQELDQLAADPQKLIDTVIDEGGLCFLAHPLERPGYGRAKVTYPWVNWDVTNFTGIELWNTMVDVKWQLRTFVRGFVGAYFPPIAINAPFPELLAKWDELLNEGRKVVAIGSSDAHALSYSVWKLTRTMYPYEFLFRTVNTHILLDHPLSDEVNQARRQIRQAITNGHCFVAYDLLASPKGFRFTAHSGDREAIMGDTLIMEETAMLRVRSPQVAKLRLIRNGQLVVETNNYFLNWQIDKPGVYRLEAYRKFWGQERGWVFTNPIYIEK